MNSIRRFASAMPILAFLAGSVAASAAPSDDDVAWIADKRGCKVANTFPRAGETITWSGACKNGYANGEGVLQWYLDGRKDDRYEGNLDMGWAEGKGTLSKAEGGKYEGDWKHSVQEGSGRYEAPDGSWYEGGWKSGKPHGQGQYRRPDGKIFIGEWVDGVFEGDIDNPQEQEEEDKPQPNKI